MPDVTLPDQTPTTTPLVRVLAGSHLYGTNTPDSDRDWREVYVPDARAILLQKALVVARGEQAGRVAVRRHQAERQAGGTRGPVFEDAQDKVDLVRIPLHRYVSEVLRGEVNATELLFAPESSIDGTPSFWWLELVKNRRALLSLSIAPFVGFCRSQAMKYGMKGSRLAAVRTVRDVLLAFQNGNLAFTTAVERAALIERTRLGEARAGIAHTSLPEGVSLSDDGLHVAGREFAWTVALAHVIERLGAIAEEYGERARKAERNEGVDWKSLSHAVRVADEAAELLVTERISFPRPNAARLLKIKRGEVPYAEVEAEVEALIDRIPEATRNSRLPAEPDRSFAEEFVCSVYGEAVRARAFLGVAVPKK